MANMRLVWDNAMARATALTASTTAGTLAASNLLLDVKSSVHRSTGTSVTYTATWSATETVGCVALAFCNLSPTATIRVRLYSDTAGTTEVYDSTAILACPADAVTLAGFTAAQAASAYAYGGGATARAWFTPVGARRAVIDVSDGSNAQGYIEASRLIVGNYLSPQYNPDVGGGVTFVDASTHMRNDAGDLLTDVGPRFRRLNFNLSHMPAADRTSFMNVLRHAGRATGLFVSVFPENDDAELERDYQLYGKLSDLSAFSLANIASYSLPVEIEEL